MTNPEVEGCQLIGAPGVVLTVSNKAVTPVKVAKGVSREPMSAKEACAHT